RYVVRQGMLEHVGELWVERPLVDKLNRLQLAEVAVELSLELGRPIQQAHRELASDHGGGLEGPSWLLLQTSQRSHDHFLDSVRDGDHLALPREDVAVVVTVGAPKRTRLQERLDDLLDEERVALGLGGDDLPQVVGQTIDRQQTPSQIG